MAAQGATAAAPFEGYGPLVADPNGLLDLPRGFSYRLLSSLGDAMADGGTVPDKADGMACLPLGENEIVLIRNHELIPTDDAGGDLASGFGRRDGAIVPGAPPIWCSMRQRSHPSASFARWPAPSAIARAESPRGAAG